MTSDFNQVHHTDCLAGMRQLPDGCIDLAFADPPFNIGYQYDEYDDRKATEDYLEWSEQWMAEVIRLLNDDGTFWLAIGDEYAAELKVAMTRELGLTCRSWVIWYYTFGVNCKYKFSRSHAHLFYMVKNPERFTFNADDPHVRVPSARQLVYGDKRANPKGRLPDDTWVTPPILPTNKGEPPAESGTHTAAFAGEQTPDESPPVYIPRASLMHEGWILRPQDLPQGFQSHEDTWYLPRVNGTFKERAGWHGCQMPEQLLGRIIRACSNPGEIVLDPFAGSGTTLAVAKKLGRQFIGFEFSRQYAARARQRIADTAEGQPLNGVENPLQSVPSTEKGRRREDVAATTRKRTKRAKQDDQQKKLL